jgi:hypothetical protein
LLPRYRGTPGSTSYKGFLYEYRKEKMDKRLYKLIQNSKTKAFLRNQEVYCEKCFENFGDKYTLDLHHSVIGDPHSDCRTPKSIPLTPQRNFNGAVVWRVTF